MAGYVIHLAVAEEYLRKTKIKENYDEFIKGVIAPDAVDDKKLTHYGEKSCKPHLDEFLKDKKLDNSFNRGYFLHLVTDYVFYNKIISKFSKRIYNDYDILNKFIIENYNVKVPEELNQYCKYKEGVPEILSKENAIKCIEICSGTEIDQIAKEIQDEKYFDKWLKIRELIYV